MTGTLMLDESGDLIAAEWPGCVETIGIAIGIAQVAQAANLAVSTRERSVWWNLPAGIDYDGLFHDLPGSQRLDPVRATAFREAVLSVPGVSGFADNANGDNDITFTRGTGRTVAVSIACVNIDCDEGTAVSDIQNPVF